MVAVAPIIEPQQGIPFVVRARRPEDDDLIYSAWVREAHEMEPARWVPWGTWSPKQRDWIRRKLESSSTLVICHPMDGDELMGFVCYSQPNPETLAVHWIYVKSIVRRRGIARAVFASLPEHSKLVFSQPSRNIRWIRRLTGASYDPWT